MKGVNVKQLRATILAVLDKVDVLLKTEPARLIMYGAAAVIFIAVQAVGHFKPGLLPKVSFDEAVGLSLSAMATLVILTESVRRFVYSPQTYIENLSDEAQAAHEAAHLEEDMKRLYDAALARRDEAAAQKTTTANVGSVKARGTSNKPD